MTPDCWEGAPVPLRPVGFQSEWELVSFSLGPGESLHGARMVLVRLKVTQGRQLDNVTQEVKRALLPLALFKSSRGDVRTAWREGARVWAWLWIWH